MKSINKKIEAIEIHKTFEYKLNNERFTSHLFVTIPKNSYIKEEVNTILETCVISLESLINDIIAAYNNEAK